MLIARATTIAAALLCLAIASPAAATAVRTFVSGKGSDANACSLVAPCRTFAGALAQTTAGGEIVVLDSAGFGAVTIAQPVTISNQTGVEGGITVSAGNAVTVDLSTAGAVTLKGLTIDGNGTAANGIDIVSIAAGGNVDVLNCTVRNFAGHGLYANPPGSGVMNMLIADSAFVDNMGNGIWLTTSSPTAILQAGILRTIASQDGQNGLVLDGQVHATLTEVIGEQDGVSAAVVLGHARVTLNRTTMGNNGSYELQVNSNNVEVVLFDHNVIGAISSLSGGIYSDGTNDVIALDGPSLNPVPLK